jgi:hypothetical protein
MSAIREAIGLPVLFLTIALLGGFRLAERVLLVPPSLTSLVLAVILLSVLVRAGVIHPPALLHAGRTGAENTSGVVVLITLFAASAQALNLLIPDRGLLHGVFALFVFTQLLTIGAAGTNRIGALRSLVVLLGALFVLRFIVLEGLYATDGSTLNRILRTVMSGATLGGIAYVPNAPLTGYVAFFTLALFVVGLLLLPRESSAALVPLPTVDAVALDWRGSEHPRPTTNDVALDLRASEDLHSTTTDVAPGSSGVAPGPLDPGDPRRRME